MAVNVGYGDEKTPDRGHQLYFAALIMVILAGLFVFGRLAARWTNRKFGMDDYTIVLSLVRLGLTWRIRFLPQLIILQQVCSIVLSITINLGVTGLSPYFASLTVNQSGRAWIRQTQERYDTHRNHGGSESWFLEPVRMLRVSTNRIAVVLLRSDFL